MLLFFFAKKLRHLLENGSHSMLLVTAYRSLQHPTALALQVETVLVEVAHLEATVLTVRAPWHAAFGVAEGRGLLVSGQLKRSNSVSARFVDMFSG